MCIHFWAGGSSATFTINSFYQYSISTTESVFETITRHRHVHTELSWTTVTAMARKVSGGLVVFCYLIVILGSASLCQEDLSDHSQECSDDNKIDLLYQKLETALISNFKALLEMKLKFFPSFQNHIQEVQILHLNVCVRVMNHFKISRSNISNENDSVACWNFKWSASALLSVISTDQLMIFDFIYVDIIYSAIQGNMAHKDITITLKTDLLPCMSSQSELQEALVQLLSWVRIYIV